MERFGQDIGAALEVAQRTVSLTGSLSQIRFESLRPDDAGCSYFASSAITRRGISPTETLDNGIKYTLSATPLVLSLSALSINICTQQHLSKSAHKVLTFRPSARYHPA